MGKPNASDSETEESNSGSSSDSQVEPPKTGKLNDYEKQRMKRIEENRARMEAMGLHKMASSLMSSSQKPQKKGKDRKGKKKVVDEDEDYEPAQSEELSCDTGDEDYQVSKEQQIRAVLYGDDIEHYAEKLILLQTYLISAARVKVSPTFYGRTIHQFYWILDRETTVQHVQLTDNDEKLLPPPTKLNITSLDRITHTSASKIDILTVVLRWGPSKYASRTTKRCREITIADNQ